MDLGALPIGHDDLEAAPPSEPPGPTPPDGGAEP